MVAQEEILNISIIHCRCRISIYFAARLAPSTDLAIGIASSSVAPRVALALINIPRRCARMSSAADEVFLCGLPCLAAIVNLMNSLFTYVYTCWSLNLALIFA